MAAISKSMPGDRPTPMTISGTYQNHIVQQSFERIRLRLTDATDTELSLDGAF